MSAVTKGYNATRSGFKSANERYSPVNGNKKSNQKNKRKKEVDMGNKYYQLGGGITPINWNTVTLLPFKKDFYNESPNTKLLTCEFINQWKTKHDIECFHGYQQTISKDENTNNNYSITSTDSKPIPNPIMEFKDTNFPSVIMGAFKRAGFEKPTPIQSCTWPILLSGYNVIGIAKTGSGKTLAFLLPAVVHILSQPKVQPGDGPIAVVIAPTRELACQIEGEVEKFACNINHCCVYGGVKKGRQQQKLETGVSIVTATPGRLIDFLQCEVINMRRVTYCVIDEADRLLDMGFKPQLHKIMSQIRPDRQMCMFSATWPKEVRSLARQHMVNDENDSNVFQVAIGSMNKLRASEDVKQIIKMVSECEKVEKLKQIIDKYGEEDENCKILVFMSRKYGVKKMYKMLWEAGYYVTCIHGNKSQSARTQALNDFKKGEMNILLATDVASRGVHVDDIKLVINFDFPNKIEDYVHRIGRTGRAGNKGVAISFFVAKTDFGNANDLIKVLKEGKQEIPKELLKFKTEQWWK